MGTLQAPTDETKTEIPPEREENDDKSQDVHRFEGKVTQEQELSASVARKRRTISKKRSESGGRPRDVTPARELLSDKPSAEDEDTPNAPERKLKKTGSNNSNKNSDNGENDPPTSGKVNVETNTGTALQKKDEMSLEIPVERPVEKPVEKHEKPVEKIVEKSIENNENLQDKKPPVRKEEKRKSVDLKTEEAKKEIKSDIKSLMDKAKQSAESPGIETVTPKPVLETTPDAPVSETPVPEPVAPVRERPARMRKDKSLLKKRSQSTPRPATEDLGSKDDLQEKKNKLRHEKEILETKLKTESSEVNNKKLIEDFKYAQILSAYGQETPEPVVSETTVRRRKPLQPAAQQFLERKKLEKALSQEMEEKSKKESQSFFSRLKAQRMSIKEIRTKWKIFKTANPVECDIIRNLKNKCLLELGLIMIFCGLGGMLFKLTEGAFEDFYKCGVKRVKRDFIEILWKGSHNLREEDWKSLARTKLKDFEEQLHTAHEAGVHSYSGQRSWSFLNGIVYALTVITSIGEFRCGMLY